MAGEDGHEVGIALRRESRERMAGDEQDEPGDPLMKAEPDRRRDRPIDDGDGARRAAQEDRFAQRSMEGNFEADDMLRGDRQMSAPPPKEKKDRKKELAAKAMERPKTI